MSKNLFNEFIYELYDYSNYINSNLNNYTNIIPESEYLNINRRQRRKYNKISFENISNIYALYSKINDAIYNSDLQTWIFIIKCYGEYIRNLEKEFMYTNIDDNNIYSEIIDNNTIVYFIMDNYKVKITYSDTRIDDISSSPLLSYLNNNNNNIGIITIEIKRTFGKQMMNVFKFISNENIIFDDKSDEILFDNIKKQLSKLLYDNFYETLNFIGSSIVNFNVNITDIIEGKLYGER